MYSICIQKSDGHRPDQQVASPGTSQGTSQVDDPQSTSPLPPMPPPERPVSAASATSNELLEKVKNNILLHVYI